MQAEGDVVPLPVAEEQAPPDFAAFFAEEHRGLFKAVYFVTGNRADAAELMQDAFLKLWERWDRVDRVVDLTGYLFRVALNGFRMRTRRDPGHAEAGTGRLDDRPVRRDRPHGTTSGACCSSSRRANAPPSSCSTCTATAPRRPLGSWASVRRPSARSRRRAVPHSAREACMTELGRSSRWSPSRPSTDLDSWKQQEDRQRRTGRNRKVGALALAAAIGIVAAIVVIRGVDEPTETQPGGESTAQPTGRSPRSPRGRWIQGGRSSRRTIPPSTLRTGSRSTSRRVRGRQRKQRGADVYGPVRLHRSGPV
jgi:Sigma-70 region 2